MRDEFALDREADMDQFRYTQIQKLLLWLSDNVRAECGDGWATWVMKWHTLEEVREVAVDTFKDGYWEVSPICTYQGNRYFNIGVDQEWISVTDNEDLSNDLSECKVIW